MSRVTEPTVVRSGGHLILAAPGLEEAASPGWFDAGEWQRAGAVAIETSGRGAVLIVERGSERWVLRHYHRGGFVARFVADHYLWLGLERTRAFREWRVLKFLREAGLPVPRPIAAHVHRTGIIYTADIITAYLPDTRKLSSYLGQGTAPADCWAKIGRMVREVHEHGVDHPDLTAHNILLDERGDVFLVDFDNARVKAPGEWRRAGVERLERSLRKVAMETGTEFDAAAWRILEAEYAGPRAATNAARGPK
jgi:3-deoxy-D-manno-octulosonic acid kinase